MSYKFLKISLIAFGFAAVVACGSVVPKLKPYHMEIQQGNVVTSQMLLQLRPGMSKTQVRYILGTPLVVDGFHNNRWDYFYQLRQEGKVVEQRRVILDFESDALKTVRGDVVPNDPNVADAATDNKSAPRSIDTTKPRNQTLAEKLQFWKKDENAPTVAANNEPSKPWLDRLKFWKSDEASAKTEAEAAAKKATEVKAAEAAAGAAAATAEAAQEGVSIMSQSSDILKEMPMPAVLPNETETAAANQATETAKAEVQQQAESAAAPVVQAVEAAKEAVPIAKEKITEKVAKSGTDIQNGAQIQGEAVQASLNEWADAWRNKDFKRYIATYAPGFKPEKMSRKTWLAQRKNRLSGKVGDIRLAIEDLKIEINGNEAVAEFYQQYASNVFSDSVTKQLIFVRDTQGGKWLIAKETVVESKTAKPAQSKVTAPEGTSEHLDGVIEKIGF